MVSVQEASSTEGSPFWRDGDELRLFLNRRCRLYAINVENGPAGVDLRREREQLADRRPQPAISREAFDQTSPPVVFKDLVIVGSRVPDRVQYWFDTPGSVQAFDTRT